MLSLEVEDGYISPIQPRTYVLQRGIIQPSEAFDNIRQQAMEILYSAYSQTTTLAQRLNIIHTLEAALPPRLPSGPLPTETVSWLQPDYVKTARFFITTVFPSAELPILDALEGETL